MAERAVFDLDVEAGDEIEVEVPGEPIRVIRIDDPGEEPVDPVRVLVRSEGAIVRRRGEMLLEVGSEVDELEIRPRHVRHA